MPSVFGLLPGSLRALMGSQNYKCVKKKERKRTVRLSLQQFLPRYGIREDFPLKPEVVVHLEVLGQVHSLPQNALQTVVHRKEVGVVVALVIAAAVEAFDVGPQGALLGLEVPGPSVQICPRKTERVHHRSERQNSGI